MFREGGGEPGMLDLSVSGIVLGILEDAAYRQTEVPIRCGDRLLIYTDGLTEAMDAHREQFGVERLTEIVRRERPWPVRTVIENIISSIHAHTTGTDQADDMTVVMLERKTSLS